jgi:hypothetical protein
MKIHEFQFNLRMRFTDFSEARRQSHPRSLIVYSEMAEIDSRLETEKYIGLSLALASGVLIGTSFIITKQGLTQSQSGGEGYDYLRNPLWWAGTITSTLIN